MSLVRSLKFSIYAKAVNVSIKCLAFLNGRNISCTTLPRNVLIHFNAGFGREDGTKSTCKGSNRTSVFVARKVFSCSLGSSIFTSYFFCYWGKTFEKYCFRRKVWKRRNIVATWLRQRKWNNGKKNWQVLVNTKDLILKNHESNEQPWKQILTKKEIPTNDTTSCQIISFVLKTDCTNIKN